MRYLFTTLLFALCAHGFAAPLTLNVTLMMDGEPLDWDASYTNAAGQDFTINLLKFYVSNVALVNADGSEVALEGLELASFEPGDATTDATFMTLEAPEGSYSGIRFDIGVPRDLNHLDATLQDAPLGVDAGMYWAWNPGYIFYRLEGQTEVAGATQPWLLHMGTDAFRLPVRIQDLLTGTVTVDVPAEGTEIAFDLDLMKTFAQGTNGGTYDFANDAYRAVHGGPISAQAYTNLLNAITLSSDVVEDPAAVEEVQAQGETAEVETMDGEAVDGEMDHSAMQDSEGEMDHGAMQDSEMDHGAMQDAEMQDAEQAATQEPGSTMDHGAAQNQNNNSISDSEMEAMEATLVGDISGTVRLPESVENWDSVIVLACTRADTRCETPTSTLSLEPEPEARAASFVFEDLPAGEYAIYALNDKDGNVAHTMDGSVSEELGLWAEPGTFNPLYVTPPSTGLDISLIGDGSDATNEDDMSATDAAELSGGDISGTVSLPDSVESWDSVIVLACPRADAEDGRCEAPIVITPDVTDPAEREASFTFAQLPAGEYGIYSLNDKDGNEAHTMQGADTEEMGVWSEPGSLGPLFVSPPMNEINLRLVGSE